MDEELITGQGVFQLWRLPYRKHEKLKAWNAADEYLLQYLFENVCPTEQHNVLILNDSFGALSVALAHVKPVAVSDSWLSQQATRLNLVANNFPEDSVQLKNSLEWPQQKMDVVLIKAPKTLAYFEDQLIRLLPLLTTKTVVIAAGMVKNMPASVWQLMERYLGVTRPSLAKKKARLIFVDIQKLDTQVDNPYPVNYKLENTDYWITNHANVFSRDSLDIGTRFLLQHLPQNTNAVDMVDLGCGNGVVGLMLAHFHGSAHLYFVDESYMAIASAKENFVRAFSDRAADFYVANGLLDFASESMDLIVCNPPFHQQNTIGNHIALSMFIESYRVLRKRGELWVIGNRHLGYHIDLRRLFVDCEEVAANKKFVIWRVVK